MMDARRRFLGAQASAALKTTALQHHAASLSSHALQEAMLSRTMALFWLVGSFCCHSCYCTLLRIIRFIAIYMIYPVPKNTSYVKGL